MCLSFIYVVAVVIVDGEQQRIVCSGIITLDVMIDSSDFHPAYHRAR